MFFLPEYLHKVQCVFVFCCYSCLLTLLSFAGGILALVVYNFLCVFVSIVFDRSGLNRPGLLHRQRVLPLSHGIHPVGRQHVLNFLARSLQILFGVGVGGGALCTVVGIKFDTK